MKTSKFLRLNWRDFLNGLIVAILGACYSTLLPAIMQWLNSDVWAIDIDVMVLVKQTISLGILPYLTKNFFTPQNNTNMDPINYEDAIAAAENIDDLGALTELPEEYYGVWVARYNELGLPEPVPTIDAIRAGSVGTSVPKK